MFLFCFVFLFFLPFSFSGYYSINICCSETRPFLVLVDVTTACLSRARRAPAEIRHTPRRIGLLTRCQINKRPSRRGDGAFIDIRPEQEGPRRHATLAYGQSRLVPRQASYRSVASNLQRQWDYVIGIYNSIPTRLSPTLPLTVIKPLACRFISVIMLPTWRINFFINLSQIDWTH